MKEIVYKRKPHRGMSDTVEDTSDKRLGFYVKSMQATQFTVPVDEPFGEPSYYRDVANLMDEASENDAVVFKINSPGGLLSGLHVFLDGINSTQATTVAHIVGECHSAASILALHCDQVVVGPYASMMCHNVSYGTGGKGSDVLGHVSHITKVSEALIRETYANFLSEHEIKEILAGREIWLDADDIVIRLAQREEALKAQEELE